MTNNDRLLFAERIIQSLNNVRPGWYLTNQIKGTTDFITVVAHFTNNNVTEVFYLMVGEIHASLDGSKEFADLLYDYGDYTDAITVVEYDKYSENRIKDDLWYFFREQKIAL